MKRASVVEDIKKLGGNAQEVYDAAMKAIENSSPFVFATGVMSGVIAIPVMYDKTDDNMWVSQSNDEGSPAGRVTKQKLIQELDDALSEIILEVDSDIADDFYVIDYRDYGSGQYDVDEYIEGDIGTAKADYVVFEPGENSPELWKELARKRKEYSEKVESGKIKIKRVKENSVVKSASGKVLGKSVKGRVIKVAVQKISADDDSDGV